MCPICLAVLITRMLPREKTTMKNIGIDFSVLKDRIWGSFDMFRNDVTNLLGYDSASPLSMTSSVPMNYGHYVRYGWDATINSLNFEIPVCLSGPHN